MPVLPDASLQQLFLEARTFNAFTAEPVSDEVLRRLYELVKLGPTSTNSHPTRFVFVRSPEGQVKQPGETQAGSGGRSGPRAGREAPDRGAPDFVWSRLMKLAPA